MDLDGDLDIIVGNVRSENTLFLNHDNGNSWQKMNLSTNKFSTYDILVKDLNRDGRPDIVTANSDEINTYFFNRETKKK